MIIHQRAARIRVIEQKCAGTHDKDIAYKLESEKTLEYALKYGGQKERRKVLYST